MKLDKSIWVVCGNQGEFIGAYSSYELANYAIRLVGGFAHHCNEVFDQLPINLIDIEKNIVEAQKTAYGCPCSSNRCCADPDIICPDHTCIEDICESCYVNECGNCRQTCCCDL